MVLTSPPYWGLRDYGLRPIAWDGSKSCNHSWSAPGSPHHPGQVEQTKWKSARGAGKAGNVASGRFCRRCDAWRGSLGLEPTPDLYIKHLIEVFDEARRVLKPTGSCWVNMGDTYCPPLRVRPRRAWLRPKQLLQIPSRFAIAMQERGWLLRNDIIWHKPNGMPSSVKDRFRCSWEHLFFFVKSQRYYFDLDAVREPHTSLRRAPLAGGRAKTSRNPNVTGARLAPEPGQTHAFHSLGKNPGDFWSVRGPRKWTRSPYRQTHDRAGAHFMDPRNYHRLGKNPGDYWPIVAETRSLGALTGVRGAVKIPGGAGWIGHPPGGEARILRERDPRWLSPGGKNPGDAWKITTTPFKDAHFAVFPERLCERPIMAGSPRGGVVLDPFAGSGTVGVVAKRLGRRFVLAEPKAGYCGMARRRVYTSA